MPPCSVSPDPGRTTGILAEGDAVSYEPISLSRRSRNRRSGSWSVSDSAR